MGWILETQDDAAAAIVKFGSSGALRARWRAPCWRLRRPGAPHYRLRSRHLPQVRRKVRRRLLGQCTREDDRAHPQRQLGLVVFPLAPWLPTETCRAPCQPHARHQDKSEHFGLRKLYREVPLLHFYDFQRWRSCANNTFFIELRSNNSTLTPTILYNAFSELLSKSSTLAPTILFEQLQQTAE